MVVLPYKNLSLGKKKQVALMFDRIAGKYDFLNRLLSFRIDRCWRRKAVRMLRKYSPRQILDAGTGTADFAIAALELNPEKVVGIDISGEMLELGKKKLLRRNLTEKIELQYGDAENLSFADDTFDAVISGFGVRNFENVNMGLRELRRVLKRDCPLVILEFSKPATVPFRQLYRFYFSALLPLIGKLISRDNMAYHYLYDSVSAFPEGDEFKRIMEKEGFSGCFSRRLTFGIVTIYMGCKA